MSDRRASFDAQLQNLHAEAGGAICLNLYSRAGLAHLLGEALAGDDAAFRQLLAVDEFARHAERTVTRCATCDRRLGARNVPEIVAIAYAHRDDANGALILGVCERCCAKFKIDQAVRGAVIGVLRRIWPDLRPIEIAAVGSRA
jgi:hypothetical protein